MRKQEQRCRGFTMMELLLAVSIIAIIGLCVANMFWASVRLERRTKAVYENGQEALMAFERMATDIHQAVAYDFTKMYPLKSAFNGTPGGFDVTTRSSGSLLRVRYEAGLLDLGQVRTVRVAQHSRKAKSIEVNRRETLPMEFLLRKAVPLAAWVNEDFKSSKPQVVMSSIAKNTLTCRYGELNTENGSKAWQWQAQWEKKDKLPNAIECSLVVYDSSVNKAGVTLKRRFYLPIYEANH